MTALMNGSAPAVVGVAFDALEASTNALVGSVSAELRAQIHAEQTTRAELERQARASLERERQMTRALHALEKETTPRATAAELPEKGRARPKASRSRDWKPSPEKLAKVWQAIVAYSRENPKGFSCGGVAKATPGISPEVVMKSMPIFREHELVRPSGKVRGGGIKWRLMPGAAELAMDGTAVEVEVVGELTGGGDGDAT